MAQKRKVEHQPEFLGSFILPSGSGTNKILVSNSEGKAEWKSISIRVPSTYGISGIIGTETWPVIFSSIGTTEEQKLVKVRYGLEGGTSVILEVKRNGSVITGLTGLEAVSTESKSAEPTGEVKLSENDKIEFLTSSPFGVPKNLSFTIFIEHIL